MNADGMEFMNTSRLECCRTRWKRWIRFFSIFVIAVLLPHLSAAETVPMENVWVAGHTTYIASIYASMSSCPSRSVTTGEFPTKAEVLAALLPLKIDFSDCSGYSAYYLYFKADSNPDNYQIWLYVGGTFTIDARNATWPIGTIDHPATYKMQCPIPKIRPNVPYTPDPNGLTCSRQDTLTITLSGGSEVEPSKGSDLKTLPIIATVKDQSTGQPPVDPVKVHVSLKVEDPKSGGHDHGDSATRPRGGLANVKTCASDSECWSNTTDGNGQVVFNFNPTETSGTHTISATCDGCTNTATKPVDVKVNESKDPGWDHLTASSDYALVGGETGKKHHDNHYLTATAREHLLATVEEYNTLYPDGPVLYLNDASLEWGGKFDIQGKWDKDSAHKNHRRGVVIDVRANQDPTAIPQARFNDFEKIAADNGVYADLHCAFSGPYVCPACLLDTGPNRHYHVRLLGQGIDK